VSSRSRKPPREHSSTCCAAPDLIGNRGELIVKLPRDRAAQLVDAGTAEHVVMGKRTMREWVELPARADTASTLSLWKPLAKEAHHYVDTLRSFST